MSRIALRLAFSLAFVMVALLALPTQQAEAKSCQRLAYSIISFGKEHTTSEAKKGVAAYVKSYSAKKNITPKTYGKVSVSCKDWIVLLNEYKCRAEQSFCW